VALFILCLLGIVAFAAFTGIIQAQKARPVYRPEIPKTWEDTAIAELEGFSDEQLYALALYLYSLQPPPNPNGLDSFAVRGQGIFVRDARQNHLFPMYGYATI
jgi:hypothetical protein